MTLRALIFGLVGALFIGTVGYFNDQVPRVNYFVGNHFPIIVFFPLVLAAMVINPLLGRLKSRLRMQASELAVIAAMMLVACNIPGSGMLRFWSRNVAMPVYFNAARTDWQDARVLERAPSILLVNDGVFDRRVNMDLITGKGKPDDAIGFGDVPWQAWRRPIAAWVPIVALVGIASICLALIVHRSWSRHDRLPYPIAQFAETMLSAGTGRQSIFRNKLFWVGAGIVLALHLVNGLNDWFGKSLISVPLSFPIQPILQKLSSSNIIVGQWATGWPYGNVTLYPTALAFACLVATDVSLGLGIAPLALTAVTTVLFVSGVPVYGSTMGGGFFQWLHAGSYIAIAVVLIYLGRRAYWMMMQGALTPVRSPEVKPHEVWAVRVLLVSMAALVLVLMKIGLDWPLAILVPCLILVMFLVMARITAESGVILIETWWQPVSLLIGLFGIEAIGLNNYAIIAMLGLQFTINGRECLLPLVVNGLRIGDLHSISPGRVGLSGGAVLLIVLLVAVPFSLWVDYNYGLRKGESWPAFSAPVRNFNYVAGYQKTLKSTNRLETSDQFTPWQRITNMQPDKYCLIAVIVGALLVLAVSALRLRYRWWPLHPVLFLFWGTWSMAAFSFSFLIGWVVKQACVRLGVRHATLRTLMIGVIAGDLVAGAMWMTVGAVYFSSTGIHPVPVRYLVYPGG